MFAGYVWLFVLTEEKMIDRSLLLSSFFFIIGQTDHFRAAVSINSITDRFSVLGTDDLQRDWEAIWGPPWDNRDGDAYWKSSTLAYVKSIKTPILFIEGQQDWRCPLLNIEQLYVALRRLEVETQLVIYPEEGHQYKKPKNIIDSIHRMVTWFETH